MLLNQFLIQRFLILGAIFHLRLRRQILGSTGLSMLKVIYIASKFHIVSVFF